jgi:hypothetical protein
MPGLLSTVTGYILIDQGLISGMDVDGFICHNIQTRSCWPGLLPNGYNGPSDKKE